MNPVESPLQIALHLKVVGIFQTGTNRDDSLAYVSSETAQEFWQHGDVVTEIDLALIDPNEAESVSRQLSNQGYRALPWQKEEPDAERTVEYIDFWRGVTILLAMAISSFGIANIMHMLVMEKTREIGMLMAIGASRRKIRNIFLFESAIAPTTMIMVTTIGSPSGTAETIWATRR